MTQPTSFLTTRALYLDIATSRLVSLVLRHRAEMMRALGSKADARTLEAAAAILDDASDDATKTVEQYGPALAEAVGDLQRIEARVARAAAATTPTPPTPPSTKRRTRREKGPQP